LTYIGHDETAYNIYYASTYKH